jgi:2-succinyl-5-enolpyruvyl-6-hydroxy-3-cyclohexene-1-carboxylate synthase
VNPSTAQALAMVDEFLRCGITDAVLAPGSRSTPLALALADAERRGEICLHVRLDERSAGYLALGLAKVTGIPAIVVTTSGTAAVNLHPAVVEADESAVPLIAVTADRPPALRAVGANQTIDQPGLFGGAVRLALDLGVAQRVPGQVRYWRSTVARAVAAATQTGRPGPVHLNIPFADPLVPDDDAAWVEDLDGRPDGRPWTADARLLGGLSTPLDDVLEPLIGGDGVPARGLVIVGDHDDLDDIGLVDDLADALGWPVIAEPSGNAASCTTVLSHGPLLLADPAFADAHVPDLVITVGRVGLSRAVLRTVARAGLHLAVDARPAWTDPTRTADLVVTSVPLAPESAGVDDAWLESWQRADVLAAAAVETALAGAGCTGVQVARTVAGRVPDGGLFFVGASWPVRHVAAFAATSAPDALVLGNRGTSGIDGCLSTAWGAAVALQRGGGAGAVALVGDHTFLYDSNALLVPGEDERPDLAVVVIDNDGGGIFASLEQGAPAFEDSFDRVFGVPLGADLAALCGAFGIPVVTVDDVDGLAQALDDALGAGGVRVIVARTVTRRDEARVLADVQAAVGAALVSG